MPKPEELNIIHQLFDNDTIVSFHSYSKDVLAQNMLIIKRLRLIYNQHNNVNFYVIDNHNKYSTESDSIFSSNSDSSDDNDQEKSKLINLTYQQAIERIRQYLTTKKTTEVKPSLKKTPIIWNEKMPE